jgi:hypothetical protein
MKKTICMTIAAVATTASLALAQADKKMPARPMGDKPMAMKGGVNETLMHHENDMIEKLQKKDFDGFQKYIMAGSWSVDETGYMSMDDFMKAVKDPKSNFSWESYKISDMKVIDVDANAKLVTYKLDEKGSFMGQPFPPTVYATTVWAKHGGNWMAVFHQESTAAPPAKK